MSSFVGHGLIAVTLTVPNMKYRSTHRLFFWAWALWLLVVAWGPDIDYVWPVVHPSAHNGLRISHSLVSSSILPGLTVLWLWRQTALPLSRRWLCLQSVGASLSHLVLDLLVGVTPLPLLYPISMALVRLPFGILPSAGKIDVENYYFWRNLYLELGVLLPALAACLLTWSASHTHKKRALALIWGAIAMCLVITIRFMVKCYALPRP